MTVAPPLALIAELTHRCPLRCPYCSNPLDLDSVRDELDTAAWLRVLDEAAALGVLHLHWTGGEPTCRADLAVLIRRAAELGLYTNLITSGLLLDDKRLDELASAGLDHVQLSFQGDEANEADGIAGLPGAHARKLAAARRIRARGLPLTLNFVVHRQVVCRVPEMIVLAQDLGAARVEIAHTQYHGWAFLNRAALLPTAAEVAWIGEQVQEARTSSRGAMVVDYVAPDYFAARPKACMGGWGQRIINISPSGRALPCHAAQTLPGLEFPSVRENSLAFIWYESEAFQKFRGTGWMREPCRTCDQREKDWGGCRCQAHALTGDAAATDPVCDLSPVHAMIREIAGSDNEDAASFVYRRFVRPSAR